MVGVPVLYSRPRLKAQGPCRSGFLTPRSPVNCEGASRSGRRCRFISSVHCLLINDHSCLPCRVFTSLAEEKSKTSSTSARRQGQMSVCGSAFRRFRKPHVATRTRSIRAEEPIIGNWGRTFPSYCCGIIAHRSSVKSRIFKRRTSSSSNGCSYGVSSKSTAGFHCAIQNSPQQIRGR